MNLKFKFKAGRVFLIFFAVFSFCSATAQQTALSPVSYWVFAPYIFNPAMVGSKDYLSLGFNAAFQGENNTQLLSGSARLTKTRSGYFSSPDIVEFTRFGVGGTIFRDVNGLSQNIGLNASGSYQIPLNTSQLSFLSFGAAIKQTYNRISSDSVGFQNSWKKTFYPNFDLGVYYYGTNFFSGFSIVNLLGSPWKPDTFGIYKVPVARQYYFTAGYKIQLSKPLNIVLEPSVLIMASDSTFGKLSNHVNSILKLYLQDFCVGTSFRSGGKVSVFGQFRYPRFYVGGFYEFKKNTPYFKNKPIVEFTLGLNIPSDKTRLTKHSHW
jgi:type IX secretion system PorP/SprF family membrane protein